jgi:hypothetical protein
VCHLELRTIRPIGTAHPDEPVSGNLIALLIAMGDGIVTIRPPEGRDACRSAAVMTRGNDGSA